MLTDQNHGHIRLPAWICPRPGFQHIIFHPVTSWHMFLCCALGDFNQMIAELRLYRTENLSDFAGEYNGIEFLYHLSRAEFAQIAAIPAGRALGILAGTCRKILSRLDPSF